MAKEILKFNSKRSDVKTYVLRADVEQDDDGRWSAWIEALPGCNAWGESRDEALSALKEAAEAYIEDIVESGGDVPRDGVEIVEAPVVTVTV
jgi:predicted RNase H-like HicB family nuclease